MSIAAQTVIATLLTIVCACYAAWLLVSLRVRLRFLRWLLQISGHSSSNGIARRLLIRQSEKIAQQLNSGCDHCGPNTSKRK